MTTITVAGNPPLGTSIVRPFADGTYTFRLKYKAASGYEREHDISLFATMRSAIDGKWNARDVREIIRLALIDGGTEPAKALRLAIDYVEDRPLAENVQLFIEILAAMMYGSPAADLALEAADGD